MLHAQSHLRCKVDMLGNGCVKDFIKRMLNTKEIFYDSFNLILIAIVIIITSSFFTLLTTSFCLKNTLLLKILIYFFPFMF